MPDNKEKPSHQPPSPVSSSDSPTQYQLNVPATNSEYRNSSVHLPIVHNTKVNNEQVPQTAPGYQSAVAQSKEALVHEHTYKSTEGSVKYNSSENQDVEISFVTPNPIFEHHIGEEPLTTQPISTVQSDYKRKGGMDEGVDVTLVDIVDACLPPTIINPLDMVNLDTRVNESDPGSCDCGDCDCNDCHCDCDCDCDDCTIM